MRTAAAALLLLLLLLGGSARAQQVNPVNVIGAVTPGHCVSFFSQTQIADAGGNCGISGGGVGSVTGTTGQITVSPTTGAVVVSLPPTITQSETFSGNVNFTTGVVNFTGTTQLNGVPFGTFATANFATPPVIGGTTPAAGVFTTLTATSTFTTAITGSTQCLQVNTAGVVSGTGSACGAGGGGAVSSVTGTAGQITTSPTTGAVVVSLPATITSAETFSSNVNFTGPFQIGGNTMTFPATAATLAGLGTAQTFTAPQTFSIAQTIASATAAVWRNIYGAGATTTITGNTGSPITALYAAEIAQPTLTDASAVTVTNAATLFVAGPPIAAGSVTITNAWAIRVGTGNVSFPGTGNVLGTITSGVWNGTLIALGNGGTGANLTASAGGILWSDASHFNVLAGTSTAGLCLLSGNLATPSWATCPGGGGTPGGANTNVQFNNSGAFGGDAGFTYAGSGQASLALGTITTNKIALNITGTWNAGAVNFDAPFFMNIVPTAFLVPSLVMDIQIGGVTGLSLEYPGFANGNSVLHLSNVVGAAAFTTGFGQAYFGGGPGTSTSAIVIDAQNTFIQTRSTGGIGWVSSNTNAFSGSIDTGLFRDGAVGTLALIDANSKTTATGFRAYNTTDQAGASAPTNYERATIDWTTTANTLTIGSQKGGTGSTRAMNIVTGGVNAITISTAQLVALPAITTDATHVDATVCEDTTTHALYAGSGAAGICLGTSSLRFKHDVAALPVGLAQIMQLQPISYKLNADHGDPDKVLYGFSAEQGGIALSTLVGNDAEGNPATFDYLGVVAVLVKAVQEQQAEIEELRSRRTTK